MADVYVINGSTLTAIADSIRAKTGTTEKLSPSAMPAAIEGISGGGGGSAEGCVTVTFMNGDEVLFTRPVYIGDDCPDPITQGHISTTPTKESTVQYNYTYSGWSLTDGGGADSTALANVAEDRVVYAAFAAEVRYYTVTFYDGENELKSEQLPYGATPTCDIPDKAGYVFDGWSPAISTVTGDATYTIVWKETTALASGVCGESLVWLYYEGGDLVITGSGEMANYTAVADVPWHEYRADITKISLPDGLITIGSQAFRNCTQLTNITLPTSVTYIYASAFRSCTALISIDLSNVINIYDYAFQDCSALSSVNFGFSYTNTIYSYAFAGCTALEEVDLGHTTYLKWRAFQECTNLTKVKLGPSLAQIGDNCFYGCPLTEATFYQRPSPPYYSWYVKASETATSSTTVSGWTTPATAATLLTSTYVGKWWFRS